MPRLSGPMSAMVSALMLLAPDTLAKRVGQTAEDFQVVKWQSVEPIKLSDYKGQVVILYFFNPYQESFAKEPARILQQQVYEYYKSRGGNQHGVPVTLLSLNIYPSGGENQTNRIISYAGLELVGIDDATKPATSGLYQFDHELLPLVVLLSGIEESSSHKMWEIVEIDEDFTFSKVTAFKDKIDSIQAPANEPPVINSFNVEPVFEGETGTLTWSITGAEKVEIDHGIGQVQGISVNVKPSEETTYTLTATNANGSSTALVTLRLFPPIASSEFRWTFKINGIEIFPFVKKWKFMHPTNGVDPAKADFDFYRTWMLPEGGEYDGTPFSTQGQGILGYGRITPKPNTGIQGVVTNVGLPDEGKRLTSYFRKTFSLDRAHAQIGFEILAVDGAVVYLDGREVVRKNFSQADAFANLAPSSVDYPSSTAYYGTTVLGKGEHTLAVSLHQDATTSSTLGFDLRLISKDPDRMAIASFTAEQESIVAGASTNLLWDVAGTHVTLSINQGVGEVTGEKFSVSPIQDTIYTLTARDGGRTETRKVTVTVEPFSVGELDLGTKGVGITFEDSVTGAYSNTRNTGTDLSWTTVRAADMALVTTLCTDPDNAENKKQFHLNNGSTEIISERIRINGYSNIAVSLDLHASDSNNGFEISDRIEVCAQHSMDGLAYTETNLILLRGSRDGIRQTALDFGQPWSKAISGFDIVTGEDGKLAAVTSEAGQIPDEAQVLRIVIRARNDSEHEHFYLDNLKITGTSSGIAQTWIDWWVARGADNLDEDLKVTTADPDGDGINNLAEYLFGGHPNSADSSATTPGIALDDENYSLTFYRVKSGLDATNAYTVEYSADLASANWLTDDLTLKSSEQGVEQTSLPDGKDFTQSLYERMEATLPVSKVSASGGLFLRIRVERNE